MLQKDLKDGEQKLQHAIDMAWKGKNIVVCSNKLVDKDYRD